MSANIAAVRWPDLGHQNRTFVHRSDYRQLGRWLIRGDFENASNRSASVRTSGDFLGPAYFETVSIPEQGDVDTRFGCH